MSKHTPGPWTHEGQGDITGIEDNGFGRGPVDVCSVYLRTVEGRHEANARLIAAAPDLLEALKQAREYIAACIHSHAETVTNPTTGLVEDPEDVLAIESDQDLLNGIDAAIARAEAA